MGKSASGKLEITEYRMSMHVGVALRLDSIRRLVIDDKEAWAGEVTANTVLNINQPNLFGGERKEGGLVGAVEVMLGGDDQMASSHLASRYGESVEDCPGFRGYTSLFFRGSGQTTLGSINAWDVFDGSWPGAVGGNGFLWRHNQPYIVQKIEVEGTCAPRTDLDPTYALIPNPDHPTRPDANPAHMIWEALVDDEFGMGASPDDVDAPSFNAAAEALFDEGFGLSMLWMRQTEVETIVDEILQHIQATLFTDPETGKLTLKLHRFDYEVESLPVINPDNARLSNWQVRSGGEVVNELTVTWTNPLNEQEESITGQVLASVEAQGGAKSSGSRNYYGVRYAGLARKLLGRDLRESTAPLASCEAVVDRRLWNLKPGDVVKVNWPRRSAFQRIMRVGKVNYGRPGSSTIRVPLVEDVFSLAIPPIAVDPGTGWVDPSADPSPLTMQICTLPSFFTRNGALQTAPIDLVDPEVLVMSLADSQDDDSLDYELVGEVADASGVNRVVSRGPLTMTPLAYLSSTVAAGATSELPATLFPDINWGPTVGGFVWFGYADEDQEIALVTGRTATGWTLSRGALDTVPRSWGAGTPVWCVNPGSRIVDELTPQAAGAEVTYRGLDRTSKGLLRYDDAPDETTTLTGRPHLPLRPADVRVNGIGFGSLNVSAAPTIEITWATRNRLLEDTQPLDWTDGAVQPEYRQETVVQFYDAATGDLVAEYSWLWLDTSISFPKAAFDRWSSVRVVVTSRRDGLWALQAHSITLTGLAGNPAAPLPPAPTARTEPPPVYPAPAPGAFAAVAGTASGSDDSSVPTIVVSGQPDPEATALLVRYRPTGATSWTTLPSVALSGEAVTVDIAAVQPLTTYDVEVAYQWSGQPGQFRTLADVTTGAVVSGETVPVTPADITEAPVISVAATVMPDGTTVTHLSGSWSGAAGAASYIVEIDDGVAPWTEEFPSTSIKTKPVRSDRSHRIRVKGVSRTATPAAGWSPWSSTVAATQDTTAPGVVGVVGVTALARRNIVQWTAPGDDDLSHFEIARNTTGSGAALAGQRIEQNFRGTVFTDTNVTASTAYYYWVRAVDRTGNVGDWVYVGAGTPGFVTVGGGDIGPTDPQIVTSYGISAGITGQGSGATANTLAELNAADEARIARPGQNLVNNPLFRMGMVGWSAGDGTATNAAIVNPDAGGFAYQMTTTTGLASGVFGYASTYGGIGPISAGSAYSLQMEADVVADGGRAGWYCQVGWINASNVEIGYSNPVTLGPNYARVVAENLIAPAGAVKARLGFFAAGAGTGTAIVRIRKVKLELGATATVFTDDYTFTSRYDNGVNIDALRPGEFGANVTETRIASGYTGQTAWGTFTAPTSRLNYLDDSGNLSGLNRITDRAFSYLTGRTADNLTYTAGGTVDSLRPAEVGATLGARAGSNLFRTDGSTVMTQAEVRTVEGVSSGITGQGSGATANTLAQLNAGDNARLSIPGQNLIFNADFALGNQGWGGSTVPSVANDGNGRYASLGVGTTTSTRFRVDPGYQITLSATTYRSLADQALNIAFYDGSDNYLSIPGDYIYPTESSWQRGSTTVTVPAGAVYARAFSYTANLNGGYALLRQVKVEVGSVATPFTNESTNGALYRSGQTIDGLQPQEPGANVTETRIASGYTGQTAWGTYSTHAPGDIAPRVAAGLNSSGRLTSGLAGSTGVHMTVPEIFFGLGGTRLTDNPEFGLGLSGYSVYDNAGGGKVTLALQSGQNPNSTGNRMAITYDGTGTEGSNPTPGFGGYVYYIADAGAGGRARIGYYARATKLLIKIMAFVPAGRTLNFASNDVGGGGFTWITTNAGQSAWFLYEGFLTIGSTGTFGNTNYWYVSGGANSAFTWFVAQHDVIDVSSPVKTHTTDMRRASDGSEQTDTTLITTLGVASGYTGQTAWGTYADYTPAQVAPRVIAGLASDGRLIQNTLSDGSAIRNAAISINPDGTLSGAGSGQVTPAGIGAATPTQVVAEVDGLETALTTGAVVPASAASVPWTGVTSRPTSLNDLDSTAASNLAAAKAATDSLGDLATLNTVGTSKIDDDSVVGLAGIYSDLSSVTVEGTGLTWTTLATLEITTAGELLRIDPSMFCDFKRSNGDNVTLTLRFIHVGTGVIRADQVITVRGNESLFGTVRPVFHYQPAAGTHTIEVRAWLGNETGWSSRAISQRTMEIMRLPTTTLPT